MGNTFAKISSAVALLGLSVALAAHGVQMTTAPDELAKKVTEDVLTVLKTDKDVQAGNLRQAVALIEDMVAPHFDFATMTRLAMGVNWRRATPAQRLALIQEFRALLVYIYAASLAQYRNQVLRYRPFELDPGATDAVIQSQIMRPGRAPVAVDYSMEKTKNGWKVYDVTIEGISLVQNYRYEFRGRVRSAGIDGLIRALADKNKMLGSGSG